MTIQLYQVHYSENLRIYEAHLFNSTDEFLNAFFKKLHPISKLSNWYYSFQVAIFFPHFLKNILLLTYMRHIQLMFTGGKVPPTYPSLSLRKHLSVPFSSVFLLIYPIKIHRSVGGSINPEKCKHSCYHHRDHTVKHFHSPESSLVRLPSQTAEATTVLFAIAIKQHLVTSQKWDHTVHALCVCCLSLNIRF